MVSWEMLACDWASYIIATHSYFSLEIKLLQETLLWLGFPKQIQQGMFLFR